MTPANPDNEIPETLEDTKVIAKLHPRKTTLGKNKSNNNIVNLDTYIHDTRYFLTSFSVSELINFVIVVFCVY